MTDKPAAETISMDYSHDYPDDTHLTCSKEGDQVHLHLAFDSEDPDMGTEEMEYNSDGGESFSEIIHDALSDLSSYLDRQDTSSFYEQQGVSPKDGIHDLDDYYGEFSPDDAAERMMWAAGIKEKVGLCLENFYGMVLPKIRQYLAKGNLVAFSETDFFEKESFTLGGIKIYASPDTVIQFDDKLVILDWKTGRPRQFYAHQMETYGLWAQCRHDVPADEIELELVYLPDGTIQKVEYGEEDRGRHERQIERQGHREERTAEDRMFRTD